MYVLARIKYSFLFLLSAVFFSGILFVDYGYLSGSIALYYEGKSAIGTIEKYTFKTEKGHRKGRTRVTNYHLHLISFNGLQVERDLDKRYEIGTKLPIFYSPSHPGNLIIANKPESFFDLLSKKIGWGWIAICSFLTVMFGISTYANFMSILNPSSEEE